MIPLMPKSLVWAVGKRYIAGLKIEDAVKYTKAFQELGGGTTIDVLGEFVSEKERAIKERDASSFVIDTIAREQLPSYLSIKPTAQGLGIDTEFAYENVKMLVAQAKKMGQRCRIDMEDSPYTDKTLDLYRKLQDEGYDNVGIVLQAKLKRTYTDIQSILKYKPNIRICKGIYIEPAEIAYTKKEDIRSNWMKCLQLIAENIPNGAYPAIATHDEEQLQFAEKLIKDNGFKKEQYQFEMLLGVREERRNRLLKEGHNVTIYVPFGEDWYGYSTRRMKENPEVAMHVFKAMFGIGQ
ncbi:MAG: proline dehydrogenase family protein [Ignavibacteria bacterium]|nr:proline dehydrogenase family protein [Ignavibacteria bacterium]